MAPLLALLPDLCDLHRRTHTYLLTCVFLSRAARSLSLGRPPSPPRSLPLPHSLPLITYPLTPTISSSRTRVVPQASSARLVGTRGIPSTTTTRSVAGSLLGSPPLGGPSASANLPAPSYFSAGDGTNTSDGGVTAPAAVRRFTTHRSAVFAATKGPATPGDPPAPTPPAELPVAIIDTAKSLPDQLEEAMFDTDSLTPSKTVNINSFILNLKP